MKKRKHRVYVDVTYSAPVSKRDAAKGLQLVIDERLDLAKGPVWLFNNAPYIDKLCVVEIQRR